MSLDQLASQPVIETDRFVLRPLRKSDAGLIAHYTCEERVARMTANIPHPLPPGAAEAFVARAQDADSGEDIWAIDGTRHGGAELQGVIALKQLDRDQSEVAFWIAPAHWNSGIASEALAALVAANPRANATMFATAFQDNPASARVLVHCGFEYLGDAEAFSVARNAAVPTWTYSRKL